MADIPFSLHALAGGAVLADIERSIAEVAESFDDPDIAGNRVVVVKITFAKAGEHHVKVDATVETKIPMHIRGDTVRREADGLRIDTFAPDGYQYDLVPMINEKRKQGEKHE